MYKYAAASPHPNIKLLSYYLLLTPYSFHKHTKTMSCFRVLLAIIFPPLAVIDRGCGSILIVTLLTCMGWVPGVLAALIILNKNNDY